MPGTKTTPQYSAGIVKAHIVYPKDPSQHAADVVMLENEQEFKPCMKNKPIDCIQVDGAADEGPSHKEVQFMWTEQHLEQEKVCTLVTTHCSRSSYLNRVELQNGCLSVARGISSFRQPFMDPTLERMGQLIMKNLKEILMLLRMFIPASVIMRHLETYS